MLVWRGGVPRGEAMLWGMSSTGAGLVLAYPPRSPLLLLVYNSLIIIVIFIAYFYCPLFVILTVYGMWILDFFLFVFSSLRAGLEIVKVRTLLF